MIVIVLVSFKLVGGEAHHIQFAGVNDTAVGIFVATWYLEQE